jgi:hypothetical protein
VEPEVAASRLRGALAWALFCVGYAAAFLLSSTLPIPVLWYFPLERRFSFEVRPTGIAADFYGRVLLCLIAGAASFLLGRLVFRGSAPGTSVRWLDRALGWSAALLLFSAGLYMFVLWHRVTTPAPLPPGYVPR